MAKELNVVDVEVVEATEVATQETEEVTVKKGFHPVRKMKSFIAKHPFVSGIAAGVIADETGRAILKGLTKRSGAGIDESYDEDEDDEIDSDDIVLDPMSEE